jgi:dipeptidyl aminopeptidase/acylaminoacyl peptidase
VCAVGVAVAAIAMATSAPVCALAQPFALADLAHVVAISTPQISPDGRRAVAVISRIDTDHNRTDDEIDLIDIADGAHRALTFDRRGIETPSWSPDGARIAFIADSGEGDAARPQVLVMRLDGGDAKPVTAAPDGVDQFAWRPDGRAIAYVAIDPAPKSAGAQRFVDAYEVGNGSNLLPGEARPYRLWLAPLDGSKPQLLTPGRGSVPAGEATSTLSFSPDGAELAYAWAPSAILNDADFATVRVVDIATRRVAPLTGHLNREHDPLFSPDGKQVAYLYSDGDAQTHPQDVYVAQRDGKPGDNRSFAADQWVQNAAWQGDGKALYFTSTVGTRTAIWRSAPDAAPARVDIGDLSTLSPLAGAVAKDGTLVFAASTTNRPPELYVLTPGAQPRRISDYNAVIASRTLGTSERVTFPTSTGITGDAVLIKPAGFTAARTYPLVVLIHGGPTDASTESFDDLGQLMAARGWLVLEPNYRGSNNLGRAYLAAIFNDVSTGPGRDIMAAIAAVRARGIVDASRIGVSGWSYGGVMTTWMITHYHIWRAAVSGAAVTDWIADYAVADDIDADLYLFRGSPFDARDRARWIHEESITYVSDVTTPVLLIADRGDARVANVSSYEFFHALRDLGKPVQFVVYPVDGHFPHDPARTADVYARWMNYIGDHFRL